ncbi:MAG TPA: phosphatase PAP2 family protein [Polyangia bacterium]|nr:phosphatase PAP2 family protein [Polyangia bacterium]
MTSLRSVVVVCATLAAWQAGADEAWADTPRADETVRVLTSPQSGPNGAPAIAAPAPDAPPQEVQKAKREAKAAALTPIVPSPTNPLKPAFQLYAEIDLPLLGIGAVVAGARFVRTQPAFCAPLCRSSDLNVIDRTTAGYWSPAWQSASNYGLVALGGGALTLLFVDEGFLPGLNDAAVVAESALAGIAAATMMTLAAGRPRPFLYGTKAPLSERNSADADLSFLSSHAAVSFAIMASTLVAMRRLHPHSNAPWLVLGVGGALASFISVARVLGGMHFITDTIGGAVVGTSLGVLVSSMHRSPVAIIPVAGDGGQRGIALCARF